MPNNSMVSNDKLLNMIVRLDCTSFLNDISANARALHEDIEIKVFYEGESTLLIGTQTVTASVGDVIVINPYEFHATIDRGENIGKYHCFMIPIDYFSSVGIEELEFRNLLLANNKSFKTKFKNDTKLFEILMRIAEEYRNKEKAYHTVINGLLMEFFAILLRRGIKEQDLNTSQSDILRLYNIIEPSLRYIRDNYTEHITVEDLSNLCKVSKHYYCRVFKTITNKTAMEYLRDYRLKMAEIMLGNSDKTIIEISEQCGFESSNYFCRCYRKVYGTSPSNHRKILINK